MPRLFLFLLLVPLHPTIVQAEFLRPQRKNDALIYGVKNGIHVAVYPAALDGRTDGGPRGLLRIGYQEDDKFYLINYLAVEPLVDRKQGFSELERGGDGQPGKRFWVGSTLQDGGVNKQGQISGRIEETPAGRVLTFVVHVETFSNGARPQMEISLFEKQPHEIRLRVHSAAGGKPMQRCVLTATMGNQSRCRQLWLRSRAVHAPALFAGFMGTDFVERTPYGLTDLMQTASGDVIVALSPDEFEPREVWPLSNNAWHHDGKWMAQYWRKPAGTFDRAIQCRVNARRVYWGGRVPIPGGLSFENFELREPFRAGQEFWFGYTTESPARAFGFTYDAAPNAAPRRLVSREETELIQKAAQQQRPLTNGDFADGLKGWQPEGGALSFRVFKEGNTPALTTYGNNREADMGRLYQCFQIPADANELQFELHGGMDGSKTYVALWEGPQLLRRLTARNDNTPFRVRWDVRAWQGKVVTFEIVDNSRGPFGFIGIQEISLANP